MRIRWGRSLKSSGPPPGERSGGDPSSDLEFLGTVYRRMLGREPDADGAADHLRSLREGKPRADVVLDFAASPEFIHKTIKDNLAAYLNPLPIRDERPDLFHIERRKGGTDRVRVFRAAEDADYDWIERRIVENGYYERPGVWSFLIDEDKRMMAEIAKDLGARTVLDFGCSNGGVLKCLHDLGIAGEGVEISRMAREKAPPEVRDSILLGDLTSLDLPRRYDLALGLDIFEHLNPNKLDAYVSRLHAAVREGGFLFANVPACGVDPVFGGIFEIDLESWDEDAAAGRSFRSVPVDDCGYPKNGHIICAATDWWVHRFERAGFRREPGIERDLHRKYDEAMNGISPARKAYYVFSR
jgi:SAM-dependent methyltransferase